MLLRRPAQLALRAALLLALDPDGSPHRIRDLAVTLGVPATYLAKVLQQLTRAGVLRATHGPGGGVQLDRAAREIHLWDVLSLFGPVVEFEQCFLGLTRCNDSNPCPLHKSWWPIRRAILEMFQTKSLAEFAAEVQRQGLLGDEGATARGISRFNLASERNAAVKERIE